MLQVAELLNFWVIINKDGGIVSTSFTKEVAERKLKLLNSVK